MSRRSPQPEAPELERLFESVLASPDDDRARLVLADALMERGDPRGELIAIQCARVEADDAVDRVQALLHEHADRWTEQLPRTLAYEFHRGFVEEVRGPSDLLARHVPTLARLTPLRRVVVSKIARGSEAALVAAMAASGVRSLSVEVPVTTELVAGFGKSGLSRNIEELHVGADAAPMLECALPKLRVLSIESEGDEFGEQLLALQAPLRELRVRVGDEWLRQLSRTPLRETIHSLVVSYASLGDLAGLGLPNLERVDVPGRLHADEEAMAAYERRPAPLRRISVESSVHGALLRRLLSATPGLEGLDASRCSDARSITRIHLPRLSELRLRETNIDLAELLSAPCARRLRLLDLEALALGDAGARAIAEAGLNELRALDLSNNDIGGDGAAALANTPSLPHLRDLDLSLNPIGEEGALALANGCGLATLTRLALHRVKVGVVAGRALKRRFGNALEKNMS